ncbi:hypothetical protein Tco_1467973 [Tanacetum coccineum]
MNDAISLIGNSENLCGLSSNKTRHLPPKPSHQEAFEGLVLNFILDQEEKVRQLKEYIRVKKDDFMQLSLKVFKKLKEEIRMKEYNSNQFKKIQKIIKYPNTQGLDSRKENISPKLLTKKESSHAQGITSSNPLCAGYAMSTRDRSGKSTRGQSSSSHEPTIEEWVHDLRAFDNDTHQMNYNALVLHSIHPGIVIDWNKPQHAGIQFRLGGEQRMLSLVELGWRVGLYSKAQRGEHGAVTSLYNSVIVKAERLIMEFLLTSVDGVFAVEHTVAKQIRDSRIRLAHHCIATTISGCKDSTQRITVMDLFYLYCIYEIVMELVGGGCHWLATRPTQPLEEDDKDEEAAEYLSTRDHLETHLQIDPFPGRETNYPPFGYTGPMPPSYDYLYNTAPDGPS